MVYTFYFDTFLLYQMGINYCLIDFLEKSMGLSSTKWKKGIVSIGVAMIATISILIPIGSLFIRLFLWNGIACILQIWILYPWMLPIDKVKFFVGLIGLYFISGSLFITILERMEKGIIHTRNALGVVLICYFCKKLFLFGKHLFQTGKRGKQNMIVVLKNGEKERSVKALLDTGNGLLFRGKPVVVVEKTVIEQMKTSCGADFGLKWKQIGTVLYHGLGETQGILECIIWPKMICYQSGREMFFYHVVLGIYDGTIQKNNEIQMILPDMEKMKVYQRV